MVGWLENNRTVDYIISTKYRNDNASAGVSFTRKLCPVGPLAIKSFACTVAYLYWLFQYPQQAVYQGGDQNSEASFVCK